MTLTTYFKAASYATVAAGAVSLAVSGGIGLSLAIPFAVVLIVAWNLEGTRWQLPERVALAIVITAVPLFYLDWKYQLSIGGEGEKVGVTALTHLVLFLSFVKLIQVKADRDWVFLYLIAFFEVLLSAGLSISPVFIVSLGVYVLCMLATIVAFEIRKAGRVVAPVETRLLVSPESKLFKRLSFGREKKLKGEIRRLPLVTAGLLAFIVVLALPLFFVLPRYGANAFSRADKGLAGFVGFSDSVTLGDIGRLQQNDRVVMRVRVEGPGPETGEGLKWRGVALDQFTGRGWVRSKSGKQNVQERNDRNFYRLGSTDAIHNLTTQTYFLEPLDTNVLFAAPRAVAVQGALPYLRVDGEGAISSRPHEMSRLSYKVYSDTDVPEDAVLRSDLQPYSEEYERYLQLLPDLDPRIRALAHDILVKSNVRNRYDAARAIERYLRDPQNFGYTLDLKAGGKDPLADFLFRVKEGHCEYFATAMAVMLRTQGVATRVVNGFQTGAYNDTADVYTVSQKDAHSWVEVYFPASSTWVSFDPTPASGHNLSFNTGMTARLGKYAEALELLWIQYFVGYDRQEQRSLATTLRNKLSDSRFTLASAIAGAQKWIASWFGADSENKNADLGRTLLRLALRIAGLVALLIALGWLALRIRRLGFWAALRRGGAPARSATVVEFYERMTLMLAERGLVRTSDQTPLEFAEGIGFSEALMLTNAYNRVRFGDKHLSDSDNAQIENWLRRLETEYNS